MNKFSVKQRAVGLSVFLIGANVLAWIWALIVFHNHPVMLSAALLAYSFGLRHAVDADHIAAIDTVTRKLMQQGVKPLCVGAFFSLGHSTIVILACLAIVVTSMAFRDRIDFFTSIWWNAGYCCIGSFPFSYGRSKFDYSYWCMAPVPQGH